MDIIKEIIGKALLLGVIFGIAVALKFGIEKIFQIAQ